MCKKLIHSRPDILLNEVFTKHVAKSHKFQYKLMLLTTDKTLSFLYRKLCYFYMVVHKYSKTIMQYNEMSTM